MRDRARRWSPAGAAGRLVIRASLALAVAGGALGVANPARAASLPGPASFSAGFVDDYLFQSPDGVLRATWLGRAHALGGTSIRIDAAWSQIAPLTLPPGFNASDPSDPNYRWSALDADLRSAAAQGETVILQLAHAPTWAEGPRRPAGLTYYGVWRPNAQAFGAFGRAAALRYSGHFPDPLHPGQMLPRVTQFQAWNEPNLAFAIYPQWTSAPGGKFTPASPAIYRGLLNAFYAGVKSAQPHAFVIAAGTAPYGDPPGAGRMMPVVFDREMFCLTPRLRPKSCPDPPHFDALDHHPYGVSPTSHAVRPDDVALPDLGKLWRILHAAEHYHRALGAGPKTIWISEVGWGSNPPDPQSGTAARQTRYLALAFYEAWIQGVSHLYWFLLRDALNPIPAFSGDGLYYTNGVVKPAAQAFRFPFVAVKAPHRKLTLWGRAPAGGRVTIEKRAGQSWKAVLRLKTNAHGIFYTQRSLGANLVLRARMGAIASPGWVTG
jgi:hypothetical protein